MNGQHCIVQIITWLYWSTVCHCLFAYVDNLRLDSKLRICSHHVG